FPHPFPFPTFLSLLFFLFYELFCQTLIHMFAHHHFILSSLDLLLTYWTYDPLIVGWSCHDFLFFHVRLQLVCLSPFPFPPLHYRLPLLHVFSSFLSFPPIYPMPLSFLLLLPMSIHSVA